MLLLSATMKKSVKAMLEWTFKDKKFNGYKITTDEAIEANILPEPKIFIHQLLLNNSFRYSEIVIKRKTGSSIACCSYPDRWQYIKDVQFKVINILCTEQEKYNYLSDQVNFWKQKTMNNPTNPFNRNKWMRAALDRKVYLGELKTDYIQHLLYEIPKSERLICFCTSINQANELHNDYNDESIVHSKIKNVEKIIQDFQNKETNALFCVNMLKEGMNLNDINTGIIIQLDSVELSFIQKLGRVLRADSPNIHIIYYKNTRDADYLSKILKLIDRKYIKVIRPK
jgi:superfamily II DNA or RNA helicase